MWNELDTTALLAAVGACWQVVGDPLGNAATRVVGKVIAEKVDALKGRLSVHLPLPENFELVRDLRADYLVALQKTLELYKLDLRNNRGSEGARPTDEDSFVDMLQTWLKVRLDPISGNVDHQAVTAADVQVALDYMVHPSPAEGLAELALSARRVAERRALDEIGAEWRAEIPQRFERWFKGSGAQQGWYDLFTLYVSKRIGTSEKFRSLFFAAEFVDLKHIVRRVEIYAVGATAAIQKMEQELSLRGDDIVSIKDTVESTQSAVRDLPAELDVIISDKLGPQMRAILEEYGFKPKDTEEDSFVRTKVLAMAHRFRPGEAMNQRQAIVEVENSLSAYSDLLQNITRGTSQDAIANAVLVQVGSKLNSDDFDGAARAIDIGLGLLAKSEDNQTHGRITLLESGVKVDIIRRDPAGVARRLAHIATARNPFSLTAQMEALKERSTHFFVEGDDRGVNLSLEIAIAIARLALNLCVGLKQQGAWRNRLGEALMTLGERERGTERLEEAAQTFRAALKQRTRDRAPLAWATTQSNLGAALSMLGVREGKAEWLNEAVIAYRAALEVRTRQLTPIDWGKTNGNLGNSLAELAHLENRPELLIDAQTALRAALTAIPRASAKHWGMAQINLGNVLWRLGEREVGTATLIEAVYAYRAALQVYTREHSPPAWGITQYNLGSVLHELGTREVGTERLRESVTALRAALEIRTRGQAPLHWADTQSNLGNVLIALGLRENRTDTLKEAVTAHCEALKEYPRSRRPFAWARTQHNLGCAFYALGTRESGTESLEKAERAYRAALEVRTPQKAPSDRALTLECLGEVLALLARRR